MELDSLLTLDFETTCQEANIAWVGGELVRHDEESGMALLSISAEGINFVCRYSGELDETQKYFE